MNKRADSSIVLLVFMTVLLCGYSLFIFVTMQNYNSADIGNIGAITNFNQEKSIFINDFRNLAEKVILENKSILNESFIREFKRRAVFSLTDYSEGYRDQIIYGNYSVSIDDSKLIFILQNFEFSKTYSISKFQETRAIVEREDIRFEISLE